MGNPNGGLVHGHKKGGKRSPTYSIWVGMKRRCNDPKFKDYARYGAAGIKVCERWNASFVAFLEDMGERPSLGHSIDRIDPKRGYEPENCRWTTFSENSAMNKRSNHPVTIDGIYYPSRLAACRAFGTKITVVHERIKAGIPEIEAITTKHRLKSRRSRESYLPKNHPDRAEPLSNQRAMRSGAPAEVIVR